MFRTSCLVVAAAVALTGCDVRVGEKGDVSVGIFEGKATDRWERTYTLPAGGHLEIVNADGAIRVSRSDGPGITVRIDREAEGSSDEAAKEALQAVRVLEEVGSNRIKVEVRRPRRDDGWQGRRHVASTFDVRLPVGATASFRTENGPVQLEQVNGTITAATTNGSVTGQALSGALTASTVNGGLQLAMDSVDGPINLTAVNGGVRLELAPGVKASVVAAAVNGGVTIDPALNLSGNGDESSGRGMLGANRVTGNLNGGGPTITAQTTNGGVRIMARGSRADPARGR